MSKTVLPADLKGVRVHFVGIKGTGMAALVEIMHGAGAIISGSDIAERFYTDDILEALGIRASLFSEDNITNDIRVVVYSSAYSPKVNPDLIAALRRKIPCMLYTEALGAYSERAYSAGICGVHGKTSTTGIVGTILKELPLPSQTLAGSVINSFGDGNSCTFTSDNFPAAKTGILSPKLANISGTLCRSVLKKSFLRAWKAIIRIFIRHSKIFGRRL